MLKHPPLRVGLIGAGIQASRTPAMHMHEGRAKGLDYTYELIDTEQLGCGVEALPRLLERSEREGLAGLNVTHPYKQAVIPLLDELSESARAVGAVNTVVFTLGRRIGHNTDWSGFAQSFRRGLPDVRMRRVVQLGAGGAGSAAAYAMLQLNVESLVVFDNERGRATRLAADLSNRFGAGRIAAGDDLVSAMARADGLIHATPTGTANYPGLPLPAALLRPDLWVAEIVYFPLETELLRVARSLGCRTLDGSGMAIFQAVEAFRLFTGIAPDAERMARNFERIDAS